MSPVARLSHVSIEVIRTVIILAIVLAVATAYTARGDSHDTTFHACLFAGSLSQVGTAEPANCGRGEPISWNAQGVQGIPGISGLTIRSVFGGAVGESTIPGEILVTCPDGLIPIGSGYSLSRDDATAIVITKNRAVARTDDNNPFNFPVYDGIRNFGTSDYGWEFHYINTAAPSTSDGHSFTFNAYCVAVAPPAET
ncbi:MAG TPA: hypothetical protein VMM78_17920 [Thermomicrobiales bacterium]|nr:hypothetical protein [Thermomicrobiales bacterium]